jgi:hypothetical protein
VKPHICHDLSKRKQTTKEAMPLTTREARTTNSSAFSDSLSSRKGRVQEREAEELDRRPTPRSLMLPPMGAARVVAAVSTFHIKKVPPRTTTTPICRSTIARPRTGGRLSSIIVKREYCPPARGSRDDSGSKPSHSGVLTDVACHFCHDAWQSGFRGRFGHLSETFL